MAKSYSARMKAYTTTAMMKQQDMIKLNGAAIWLQMLNKLFPKMRHTLPSKLYCQLHDVANEGYNEYKFSGEYTANFWYPKPFTVKLRKQILTMINDLKLNDNIQVDYDNHRDVDNIVVTIHCKDVEYKARFEHIDHENMTLQLMVSYSAKGLIPVLKNEGFEVITLDDRYHEYLIQWDIHWYDIYQKVKDNQTNCN